MTEAEFRALLEQALTELATLTTPEEIEAWLEGDDA